MGKRLAIAIEAGFVLFAICAGVALFLFNGVNPHPRPPAVWIAVAFPALAAITLMFAVMIVPGLIPRYGITFPLNLTFPALHTAFLAMVAQLVLTRGEAVEVVPSQLQAATIWQRWPVLGVCFAFGVCALSAFTAAHALKKRGI